MTIRWVGLAILVLVVWVGLMAGVMVLSDAAPAAVVLLPSQEFLQNLPEDVAILSRNTVSITLQSDRPELGLMLYRTGALLVLPAGLVGCLPLDVPSLPSV